MRLLRRALCVLSTLCLLLSSARAQEAAPSKLDQVIAQLQQLRDRLRFELGAGVYLYYYQPLSADTTLAGGSLDGTFQVFFYYLRLEAELHGFGAHTEMRMRDGGHVGAGAPNTYFRGFYSSNFWFQQVYAYYTPGPFLKIKVGKVHRQFGIFWDDSFFGNIPFYDGLKLNPDYGASLEGELRLLGNRLGVGYAAQYFLQSDGINGGLDFGRTLGAVPTAVAALGGAVDPTGLRLYSPNPEGQRDSAGGLVGVLRHVVVGRASLSLHPRKRFGATVGGSGMTALVQRASSKDGYSDEARMSLGGADLTLDLGPALLYGEYLRQLGPAVRDAEYVLAGARVGIGPVSVRVNTSYVRYHLDPEIEEFMIQPGITWSIGWGLTAFLEYNEWERRDPRLGDTFAVYDRSLNTVLGYAY